MTTPFPFTAGQTLTAAQMNAITELPINDKTASHTLTASDAGDIVVMNSASATTITVNASVFTTGQVVYIVNKGTASTVITAGAGVTVSTSGSLTVPANGSGRLLALSASAFIYEAGGITATASGLTLVSSQTFTAASTVSMAAGTFTSTYLNYRVFINITASSAIQALNMRVNASGSPQTASQYFQARYNFNGGSTITNSADSLADINRVRNANVLGSNVIDVFGPADSSMVTVWTYMGNGENAAGNSTATAGGGFYNVAAAHDGLTFFVSGTITGTLRAYGFANS
jgi:acetylornithine deacetylase/succinyl-diaminopimelate desuccinylase-like protein